MTFMTTWVGFYCSIMFYLLGGYYKFYQYLEICVAFGSPRSRPSTGLPMVFSWRRGLDQQTAEYLDSLPLDLQKQVPKRKPGGKEVPFFFDFFFGIQPQWWQISRNPAASIVSMVLHVFSSSFQENTPDVQICPAGRSRLSPSLGGEKVGPLGWMQVGSWCYGMMYGDIMGAWYNII